MLPTALAGGAARRPAARADGGRACRGAARTGTQRVLKQGWSKKGTRKGYSKQGTQNRVLKIGFSKQGTHRSGETPSSACGRIPGQLLGSARQGCAHSEYGSTYRVLTGHSKGTPSHGVLTGYSWGTHTSGSSHRPRRCAAMRARVQRQEGYSRGTPRVLIGCSRGLTRYSHGTAHPATHASLLRVLVADCVGRSGQCTAARGTRA
jgi:hypothetical protein